MINSKDLIGKPKEYLLSLNPRDIVEVEQIKMSVYKTLADELRGSLKELEVSMTSMADELKKSLTNLDTSMTSMTGELKKSLTSLDMSMNTNAKSSDQLSNKVYWLNVILTIITFLGVVATVYGLFFNHS